MSEDSGMRLTGERLSSLAMVLLLAMPASVLLFGGSPAGSAWASALDIGIVGITSHTNGTTYSDDPHTFKVRILNAGTDPFTTSVIVNVSVWSGASPSSLVFSNETDLGTSLSASGSQVDHIFPEWTPDAIGKYIVNVTVLNPDDVMSNNSAGITIFIVAGSPYKFRLVNMGLSAQAIEKGKTTLDNGNPYIFKLVNKGALPDKYNISIQSAWAMKPLPTNIVEVKPENESKPVAINVKVPIDANPYDWDTMIVTVISFNDKNISQIIVFNTTVAKKWGVKVDPAPNVQRGYPGGPWINFTFIVTNIGEFADIYKVSAHANPVNWTAKLWTSDYTNTLSPGEPTTVYAGIRIPELDYDNMMYNNSKRGDLGWLTLQAESLNSDAQGSAEGIVEVGLVHTVQMIIKPMEVTVPWFDTKEIRTVTFNLSVRSVSNDYGIMPPQMIINMSAPKGPNGVEFTPIWSFSPNKTESKRWAVGFNGRNISLEPGAWSQLTQFKVYYPTFPISGTAAAQIKVSPQINATFDGMAIPKRETVFVHVDGMRNFTLEPPRWEFFNNTGPEPDFNGNEYPDWKEGAPGDVLTLPFNITNIGNTWESYSGRGYVIPLEGSVKLPDDWKLEYPNGQSVGPLLPRNFDLRSTMFSELFPLRITVPRGAPIGERINVTLVAYSQANPGLVRQASVEIRVVQGYGLDLEPENTELAAVPDQTVRCTLNLTNTGNGLDIARIQYASAGLTGWTVEFNSTPIELLPDTGTSFDVFITPSSVASADQVLTIRMRAVSVKMPAIEDSVIINVTVMYLGGVEVEAIPAQDAVWRYPGEVAPFKLIISNTGNGNDTFDLAIVNISEGWTYTISGGAGPSAVYVPRGDKAMIWINISIPSMDQASEETDLERLGITAMNLVSSLLTITPRGDPASAAGATLTVGILQLYESSVGVVSGERSQRSVLVGEDAAFKLFIQNRGNGKDIISCSLQGVSKHLGWSHLSADSAYLPPFGFQLVTLTVTPNPNDLPLYDEKVSLNVRCFAGDNMSYRTVPITVDIAMARLGYENVEVDLGTAGLVEVLVCNMPDPNEVPYGTDFPVQNNYSIWSRMDTDGVFSEGWSLLDNTTEIFMTQLYEIRHVWVRIKAPPDLMTGSPYSRITLGVYGGEQKTEELVALAKAVFFDCSIDIGATGFYNLFEGGEGHASVKLIATGNRGQLEIPLTVKMGGKTIGTFVAGPAHPENYSEWGEPLQVEVFFDLPTLGWYEKGKKLDIEIVIDPENKIVENTQDGRVLSESNNYMLKSFTISNYSPRWPIFIGLALLFIVSSIAGIVGYVMHEKRNSYYLLPLATGLSGILALVFYLPIERGWNLSFANGFGIGIVLLDLIVILPIMVYLFTRAGNAYILHLLKKRSPIGADIEMETIGSPLMPYLISFAGGLLLSMVPIGIWVLPAYLRDDGAMGIIRGLADNTGVLPVWGIVTFAVLMSVAAQFVLLALKRQSMKYVLGVSDKLESLSREIEEELE